MKKLLALVALVAMAGCTSVKVNPGTTLDCMKAAALKCAAENVIVSVNGDTLDLSQYGVWDWEKDGSLVLKDKR